MNWLFCVYQKFLENDILGWKFENVYHDLRKFYKWSLINWPLASTLNFVVHLIFLPWITYFKKMRTYSIVVEVREIYVLVEGRKF